MPLPINEFYKEKSIQRSFNFKLDVFHDDAGTTTYLPDNKKIPEIKDYHVLSISLPLWEFKKEVVQYGSFVKTFPVLNTDGFEFTVTLEEDDNGTVINFINYLQKKIIKKDGTYVAPNRNKITMIYFRATNMDGKTIWDYQFDNCYFLKASNPEFSYVNNETVKYDITFNCDFPKFYMLKGVIEDE